MSHDDQPDSLVDVVNAFSALSEPFQGATKRLLHPQHEQITEAGLTEAAYAQRFAEAYGLDLRYHHRRGVWLWYDVPLWRPDDDGRIYRQTILFAKQCQQDALDIRDRKVREKAMNFYIRQESKASIEHVMALARNLHPITDAGEGWDADFWRIGAPNGVINLHTGELEAGDPADKISYSVRVAYDLDETNCPRWLQFLEEVFAHDPQVIAFVQQYCGYCLTGCTNEQVLAVFHGRGANGKSTLLNTLSWLLGDYAYNMPFSTVDLRSRSGIPNDLAALDGRRFVTASETSDGTRLNEGRIKALTGGDLVTARFMRGEFFTFQPVAKFVLSVNHKPTVADDSYGFWRRIRLVPFGETFSGSSRDDKLEAKLRGEGAGILRWLVQGCLEWQHAGLLSPAIINAATDAYKQDSDPLGEFLESSCESAIDAVCAASELHTAYHLWAEHHHVGKAERLSHKDFGRRMADRFDRKHTMTGWRYYGVRVLTQKLW